MPVRIIPWYAMHSKKTCGYTGHLSHEVLHRVSSWEEQPPDINEMKDRHASIAAVGFPYRVLQVNGELDSYSYA